MKVTLESALEQIYKSNILCTVIWDVRLDVSIYIYQSCTKIIVCIFILHAILNLGAFNID